MDFNCNVPLLVTWNGLLLGSFWPVFEPPLPLVNDNEVKVGYVVPNSPAEKSGIIVNDIIIKVGNKDIKNASDVISQISKNGIKKQINVILKRKNKLILVKVIPTDITNLSNR